MKMIKKYSLKRIYLLAHISQEEDCKLIGAYSSEFHAQQALARVKDQPGFCDYIEGFKISELELNKNSWPDKVLFSLSL